MNHFFKLLLTSALLIWALAPAAAGATIDTMTEVGSGKVYYLGFIKVYDAHLFTTNQTDQQRILDADVSKCLKLTYDVKLKPEDFIKGANMVLERQHPTEHLEMLKPHIDALHDAYQSVDKGDTYLLCYDAQTSTTSLSLNETTVAVIESEPFSSAYFGIWLSPDQPLSSSLQKDLVKGTAPPAGD
jgi:hypothetical protein